MRYNYSKTIEVNFESIKTDLIVEFVNKMTGPWIAEVEDCSDEYIANNAKKLRSMIYFGGKDGDLY